MADARFLVVAGKRSNLLARALLTSSSADTNYGLTRLPDGDGGSPFRFLTAGLNDYWSADLDLANSGGFRDGGFEAATFSAGGHTSACVGASNTAAPDATVHDTGSQSAKLTLTTAGASNIAAGYDRFLEIPSGSWVNAWERLRGDGTVYGRMRVYCEETAQWLTSGLTWGAVGGAAADVGTNKTTSFTSIGGEFQMPTYATCGLALLTLRVYYCAQEASSTGAAWCDGLHVWPSCDFYGIHGHNFSPVTVSWKASTTGAFAGEESVLATPTVQENTFYALLPARSTARYQRLYLLGTNADSRTGGPMAWCGSATLSQAYSIPNPIRDSAQSGITLTTSGSERRTLTVPVAWQSSTERAAFLQEILRRSWGGRWPCWIVPFDTEADVLFCRLSSTYADTRPFISSWKASSLVFTGCPYPVWT
jgi:hypothetical protein